MDDREWATRVDLAAAYRLVDLFGWSDLLGTHLSARLPGRETYLINPYGVLFEEMTSSQLVEVDLDGRAVGSDVHLNPAALVIHGGLHGAIPRVACVIHTHTAAGVGVATQKGGLLALTQHALAVLDHTRYHDYEGIATDPAERRRLVEDLGDANILILRNHGLLTVGATIAEAFVWMYRAERACCMQLAAQQSGAELITIPEDVQRMTFERNRLANSGDGHRPIGVYEWPALLRKLDRIDKSYKT